MTLPLRDRLRLPVPVPIPVAVPVALAVALTALRQHVVSAVSSAAAFMIFASLFRVPVPLALAVWAAVSLLALDTWLRYEPVLLRRLGCRCPSHLERERLAPAQAAALEAASSEAQCARGAVGTAGDSAGHPDARTKRPRHPHAVLNPGGLEILVLDVAEPWLGVGVRSLVVTRALLDLLDDRELVGALAQAVAQMRSANLPGELVVWLGGLPLVVGWCMSRWMMALGRLLAVVVGASLVVPLLFCAEGFTRWVGRTFGALGVALLGAALLSSGLAGPGLSLVLGWALVPGLAALLGRERHRAELAADDATLAAGLGWQLVEALETLAWTASSPTPPGPLGLLCQQATRITDRADRVWQALTTA